MSEVLFEVCIDSLAGAVLAREAGAHRLELCSSLIEGGITPSVGVIELAVERAGLPVMVMIRPRGGDFCYDAGELQVMRRDIDRVKAVGAAGVVLGLLGQDGRVDLERTAELVARARPLAVTFHRAIDMSRDLGEAMEDLVTLGVERVLTSGGERTALDGAERLRALVEQGRGRIVVVAGGGITERNVARVLRETGVREVHASARSPLESPMRFRNSRATLGGELRPAEYSRAETDAARVSAFARALRDVER